MITVTQIIDSVLPLTREDRKCGFKKNRKLHARYELILLINDYKEGKKVDLPEQVLMLLNEC